MLTFDQLDALTDPILELYERYIQSVLNDIARRLAGLDFAASTAAWQMQRLIESGRTYDQAITELTKISGKSDVELRKLFEKAGVKSIQFDDAIYRAAGLKPLPLNLSPAMAQVLAAGLRKTQGVVRNLTMTTALSAQNAFIDAADLAYMQVSSGAFDYISAIRNAIKEVATKGLQVIQYPSGRHDQLDIAIRRTVLTGVSQTTGNLQLTRADEMECDLVAVSAHIGARNIGEGPANHESWQGKIYSKSGADTEYQNFVEVTGYGTVVGLHGINCRHSFYPFFEGISEAVYTQAELDSYANKTVVYNGKELSVYEATQVQRGIERKIRHWKRQAGALEASGLKDLETLDDLAKANGKVKEWQGEMRKFVKETGLIRQPERERVGNIPNLTAQAKKIDFSSSEFQYVADLGDIRKYYEDEDSGKRYVIPRPVYYNSFSAGHLTDEGHKYRLQWLDENEDGFRRTVQVPDFIEKRLRIRDDGHYSATLIGELRPGTKNENRFVVIAVSLSLEPGQGYHQITTVHPAKWKDLFYTNGELKSKYRKI